MTDRFLLALSQIVPHAFVWRAQWNMRITRKGCVATMIATAKRKTQIRGLHSANNLTTLLCGQAVTRERPL